MKQNLIANLIHRLDLPLPGKDAQRRMMTYPYKELNIWSLGNDLVPAAVLILLFPLKGTWHFFLTKRSKSVAQHKGQISLPGGVIEKGESKKEAALRETNEEIGIQADRIKIIGSLSPFQIPVTKFRVFPFVGWIDQEPAIKLQMDEVDYIVHVPIFALVDEKNKKNKKEKLAGKMRVIPYFHLQNEIVWGATSIILSEFREILKDIL